MIILGIESSCDECAAAVVEDGKKILSNIIYSQVKYHQPFYGVVPEIASRKHLETIEPVVAAAISESGVANLFSTAASYVKINTRYRFKVTRNSFTDEFVVGAVGTFAVYIRGGDFGTDYVLVDVSGGTGSNPATDNTYTTSNYLVADLDTGDQISNILIKKGVEQ